VHFTVIGNCVLLATPAKSLGTNFVTVSGLQLSILVTVTMFRPAAVMGMGCGGVIVVVQDAAYATPAA
jgi:hypothetical protein